MKVLITGFDPFGEESINPALEAVKALPSKLGEVEVIKLEIPTVFYKSLEKIEEAVQQHKPDRIICVGQAGGRCGITPERIAININDARIEDNEGNAPIDTPVIEAGENAYFTNLPIKAMTKAMVDAGIPATVSNTAGTFVCNHVMYGVLHMVHTKYKNIRAGFIHVPYIPEQIANKGNMPSMALEHIIKGLTICIQVASEYEKDCIITNGTIC